MAKAKVTWVEISTGEIITDVLVVGIGVAVATGSGRAHLTSSNRPGYNQANARPVRVQVIARGVRDQAGARAAHAQAISRSITDQAEEREQWAP